MKYIGVDGCAGGWVAVVFRKGSATVVQVFDTFSELWQAHEEARSMLVDMPIGLPDATMPVRAADMHARSMLGPRKSSVFAPPLRELLDCPDHSQANETSRQLCGRGISRQAWNIVSKIRQVDEVLRRDINRAKIVREAHPELCFAALHGAPMDHYKKTLLGGLDRLHVLQAHFARSEELLRTSMAAYPRGTLSEDDVLDALVLGICASKGRLQSLPESPPLDGCGLPMAIWYHAPESSNFKLNKG